MNKNMLPFGQILLHAAIHPMEEYPQCSCSVQFVPGNGFQPDPLSRRIPFLSNEVYLPTLHQDTRFYTLIDVTDQPPALIERNPPPLSLIESLPELDTLTFEQTAQVKVIVVSRLTLPSKEHRA